jgi:RNA polymerase sigma factor (sigma-70 family)
MNRQEFPENNGFCENILRSISFSFTRNGFSKRSMLDFRLSPLKTGAMTKMQTLSDCTTASSPKTLPEWGALYAEHQPALCGWLANRVGISRADDLSHDIWLRIADNLHKFDGKNFRAWMFTLARNYLIDYERSAAGKFQRKTSSLQSDTSGEKTQSHEPWVMPLEPEEDSEVSRLRSCLEKLDAVKREVIQVFLDNVSYDALVARLGITHQQAYRQLHTAKTQLRKCTEGNES